MLIALGLAVATNLFAYWNSDRLALAAHGAQEVDLSTAPTWFGWCRSSPIVPACRIRASM